MSTDHTITIDERKRRAKFRAWHRGMQEADLILGRFADAMLPAMSEADLTDFEVLLEVLDQDILDWLMGRTPVPANMQTNIVDALMNFDWQGAAK